MIGFVALRRLLAGMFLALTQACAPTLAQAPETSLDAAKADVRVTTFDTPATIRVGQTLGIAPPTANNVEWQVDYDVAALRLLTPPAELANPAARGWVWRATRAGESEVVLTSRTRCREQPCQPTVMRFTARLNIQPEER